MVDVPFSDKIDFQDAMDFKNEEQTTYKVSIVDHFGEADDFVGNVVVDDKGLGTKVHSV